MIESKSVGVAAVEVVGSALWPAFALIAALLFAPSVKNFLDSAATQVKNANTIKVGSVELTVSKDSFPKPPHAVAGILPKLAPDEIDFILSKNSPEGQESYCYEKQSDQSEITIIKHLQTLGLFTNVEESKSPKALCNDNSSTTAFTITYSSLFKSTRNYYFDVIKELKFSDNP